MNSIFVILETVLRLIDGWDSPKLISRKIKVAEKWFDFHTVNVNLTNNDEKVFCNEVKNQ